MNPILDLSHFSSVLELDLLPVAKFLHGDNFCDFFFQNLGIRRGKSKITEKRKEKFNKVNLSDL